MTGNVCGLDFGCQNNKEQKGFLQQGRRMALNFVKDRNHRYLKSFYMILNEAVNSGSLIRCHEVLIK